MTTYRTLENGELEIFTAAELAGAKFAIERTDNDPAPRHLIFGEWYCQNQHCSVREVQIHAKWPDGDRPAMPRFTCPSCSLNLKFHGFIKETTLLRVKDGKTAQPSFGQTPGPANQPGGRPDKVAVTETVALDANDMEKH